MMTGMADAYPVYRALIEHWLFRFEHPGCIVINRRTAIDQTHTRAMAPELPLPDLPTPDAPATSEGSRNAALRRAFRRSWPDEPFVPAMFTRHLADHLKDSLPSLPEALVGRVLEVNEEDIELLDRFGLSTPVVLLADREQQSIFEHGVFEGWDIFYRRYAGAQGILTLSQPGFDDERRQALLYAGNLRGGMDGAGEYFLAERAGSEWVIRGSAIVWLS
jgi:hypothetical protein